MPGPDGKRISFNSLDGVLAAASLRLQNLSCESQVPGRARKELTGARTKPTLPEGKWLPGQAGGHAKERPQNSS